MVENTRTTKTAGSPEDTGLVATWRRDIIKNIVETRVAKGWTQSDLAEKLNTHRSNISRLESGEHNPTLDLLLRVASVLDMELDLRSADNTAMASVKNSYELRLYDMRLLTFTLEERGIEGLRVASFSVDEKQRRLLPLGISLSEEGILKWLDHRTIPNNRAHVDDILKSLGLSFGNTKGILDVCKGLSLNDSYWVVPSGFAGSFSEYNLYENRFSEILSLVAYTGIRQSHQQEFTTSPELTTGGTLPKAWRHVENDGIFLYKGGTSGAANAGNEPFSEFYACQIAEAMGLNTVQYDLEVWKGILASKCRLFTDRDTAYIPIGSLIETGGLKSCLTYYDSLGEDFAENIRSMLVFDAVIYNEDRHFGNFGLLRDNHSGAIIAPAPLFDHGFSLFNFAMEDDFKNLEEYAGTRSPAYRNTTFESIVGELGGKAQARQLRSLIGFVFRRHGSINWPEWRLEAIERHLQKRVRSLLGLIG